MVAWQALSGTALRTERSRIFCDFCLCCFSRDCQAWALRQSLYLSFLLCDSHRFLHSINILSVAQSKPLWPTPAGINQ